MSVWQALPNVTKPSSTIQAESQPASRYMSQLIMPANPHRLCTALKPGHIDMTQPFHNNPNYPHLDLCLGIKLPRFMQVTIVFLHIYIG